MKTHQPLNHFKGVLALAKSEHRAYRRDQRLRFLMIVAGVIALIAGVYYAL